MLSFMEFGVPAAHPTRHGGKPGRQLSPHSCSLLLLELHFCEPLHLRSVSVQPSVPTKAPCLCCESFAWKASVWAKRPCQAEGNCAAFFLPLTELVFWVLSKRCLNADHNICLVTQWNVWDIFIFSPEPKSALWLYIPALLA